MLSKTKKNKTIITLLLVLSFVIFYFSENLTSKVEAKTIIVPDDYPTITDAIGNASTGDTVFVKRGIYECPVNQSLVINKTISFIGEDAKNTIIKLYPPYNVIAIFPDPPYFNYSDSIVINADNVRLTSFTIVSTPGGGVGDISVVGDGTQIIDCNITKGITLRGSDNNITGNTIGYRFTLKNTSSNIIVGNTISEAVYMEYADSNVINNNTCMGFTIGYYGRTCSYNTISRNIMNGDLYAYVLWGICIDNSGTYNVFHDNYIANYHNVGYGGWGVSLASNAVNNTFYRNTIINNDENVESSTSVNFWDNGKEGNYWSDYNGTDNNGDGIGDTPYIIDENNQDNYPLMAPITIFDAGTWEWTQYNVSIISNSTISDFSFNPEDGSFIRFNVEGETGTTGFCRVTIPKDLLHSEDNWTILVDGTSVTPTVNEDTTDTYLYFTYNHSTKTVEIIGTDAIPEFPSWIILPLLITATLVITLVKKKYLKNYHVC
jgi:nitrous oxidase accessory protein